MSACPHCGTTGTLVEHKTEGVERFDVCSKCGRSSSLVVIEPPPPRRGPFKWRDLTSSELLDLASKLRDDEHDMRIDRESIIEEAGADLCGLYRCLIRRLEREAKRRGQR